MKVFEAIAVDEDINRELIDAFKKVTYDNFQIKKINYYAYHCINLNTNTSQISRYYLYLLLNEFTRSMYLGITHNIKNRLQTHANEEVLGSNNNVILNALFIVDLEEIQDNKGKISPISQITSIENKLTYYLQELGLNVRCNKQEQVGSNNIERHLSKRIDRIIIDEQINEEFKIIDGTIKNFKYMVNIGGYYYFSNRDGEIFYEFSPKELQSIKDVMRMCDTLLAKKKKDYQIDDWEFIRKCLNHEGLRISLWEQGIGDPNNMLVFKRNLYNEI
ncbi:hypothetical protein MKZ01_08490 [Lysinibacillus endophyticus]|uniref:hypothetical protein n=1 Tax=Ureibacillus endophyticus TaxID=1978490 RepID=UPI003134A6FE